MQKIVLDPIQPSFRIMYADIPARRAEKAACERLRAAIAYLYRFSLESKFRWAHRGWIVMLRARHQVFLAQQQQQAPKKPRVWLCLRKAKDLCGITRATMENPLSTAAGEPSTGSRDADIDGDIDIYVEQCEEGRSDLEFERAVVSVVGIAEEGLFRHVILYL